MFADDGYVFCGFLHNASEIAYFRKYMSTLTVSRRKSWEFFCGLFCKCLHVTKILEHHSNYFFPLKYTILQFMCLFVP